MDLKKYSENKKHKDELKERFDFIKEMEESVVAQYDAINNTCEHDLILKLKSKIYTDNSELLKDGYYTCLCCNMAITKGNLSVPNNFLKKLPKNVIDATEIVSEENIDVETWRQYELDTQGSVNVFVLRAQEKLNELAASGENLSTYVIKDMILEDLKTYDSILKGRAKTKK